MKHKLIMENWKKFLNEQSIKKMLKEPDKTESTIHIYKDPNKTDPEHPYIAKVVLATGDTFHGRSLSATPEDAERDVLWAYANQYYHLQSWEQVMRNPEEAIERSTPERLHGPE